MSSDCPPPLQDGWWRRRLDEIDGLTFHHTLSYSPWATATSYIKKGHGRPSIPYHLWICGCGTILHCLELEAGCWHDHTGHKNTHISIGLAGRLHEYRPTVAQFRSAALVAQWAVENPDFNISSDMIKGHNEYARTACPGWEHRRSGYWREELLAEIDALLNP